MGKIIVNHTYSGSLNVNYDRKMFIRLAADIICRNNLVYNVLVPKYLLFCFTHYFGTISNSENILKTLLTSVNQP